MNIHRIAIILMRSIIGAILWSSLTLANPESSSATALSTAAVACAPGAFCQVTEMTGLTAALIEVPSGGHMMAFCDKFAWDSQRKQAYFAGRGHTGGSPIVGKLIRYDDATNTWTQLAAPTDSGLGVDTINHCYQHTALNSDLGYMYHRPYNGNNLARYSIAANTWATVATSLPANNVTSGVTYFPELGKIIVFSLLNGTNGGFRGWQEGGSWITYGNDSYGPIGRYQMVAVYNPVHKIVVAGGGEGSTKLFKLNASGTVSAIADAPVGINVGTGQGVTIFTVDPVSGDYLLFSQSGPSAYKYNVATNVWTAIPGASNMPIFRSGPDGSANNSPYGTVATPVTNYGVVMFILCGGISNCSSPTTPQVWIYKHAAGGGSSPPPGGDTSAPSTPGSLSASAVSSSQINLSWSAATDNVGVTGYKVFRNGTQTGTSTGTLYQDVGLSASTTNVYTVQAYDAAGNISSQSSGDSATTLAASTGGGTDFQTKCLASGVINCFGVDSSNQLFYTWPTGTVCDSALGSNPNGNNQFGQTRVGPGNVVAHVESNGQCVYPEIDSTVKHNGVGSLKFTIGSHTGSDSAGYYTEPFKRLGNGQFAYIGPGSQLGNVLYFQFYQMSDSNFLDTNFQCTGGGCGGWKQMIWYGNAPFGSSSSLIEVTHNNGWQRGVPQMYGQQGHDDYGVQNVAGCPYAGSGYASRSSYPEPPCVRYKASQWMEFTGRIEVRGTSNSPSSRVQLWVDGKLVIDYGQAMICWGGTCGDGDGIGSFLASPYHTNKDSSQNHPTAFTWMDDIIVSTQPIAMTNSSVPNSPPAAPVNLRVQ